MACAIACLVSGGRKSEVSDGVCKKPDACSDGDVIETLQQALLSRAASASGPLALQATSTLHSSGAAAGRPLSQRGLLTSATPPLRPLVARDRSAGAQTPPAALSGAPDRYTDCELRRRGAPPPATLEAGEGESERKRVETKPHARTGRESIQPQPWRRTRCARSRSRS